MSTQRVDAGQEKGGRRRPDKGDWLERGLPNDLEAERGVIGSILLQPDVSDEVAGLIRHEDFFDEAHKRIFAQLTEMRTTGIPIDGAILVDRLRSRGELEIVGGVSYLSKLLNAVPTSAHVIHYAEIVRTRSDLRGLIEAATSIVRKAYEDSGEVDDLLGQAEQAILSIRDNRGGKSYQTFDTFLNQVMDRLVSRMKGEHTSGGVETGFYDLDKLIGGLHNGELVVLAARPSMGKTAFAMNIAENVSIDARVPVLFVSLEMSGIELVERLVCSRAETDGKRLRTGSLNEKERKELGDTIAEISDAPLLIDDQTGRTVSEIGAVARRARNKYGRLGLIVVDYLQLIEPDNMKDPRQEQVARMTRRLKGLARDISTPILCLAQLNRQTEASKDNIPRLSHLRESGAIEQDADVVMFVHREEYYLRGEEKEQHAGKAQIIVAKQRNGPIGDVNLRWDSSFTKFRSLASDRFDELDAYAGDKAPPDPFY